MSQRPQSFLTYLQSHLQNIPKVSQLVILASVTVYTLSFGIEGLLVALANIPQKSLLEFQFYRLFTAVLV